MENDPKYTAKSTQEFSKAKNWIFFSDLDSYLISTQQSCFSVTEDKTEGRETLKWAATEGGCSKGLDTWYFLQFEIHCRAITINKSKTCNIAVYVEIVLHKGQAGKFYQIIFILKDKKQGRETHARCFDRKVN